MYLDYWMLPCFHFDDTSWPPVWFLTYFTLKREPGYPESRLFTLLLNVSTALNVDLRCHGCYFQPYTGPLELALLISLWSTNSDFFYQQLFFLSNVVLLFLGISQHLIQITYYGHGNSRQYYNVGVFKSTGLGVTLRLGFWFFYFFLYYLDKMISLTWPWFLKLG